MMPKYLAMAVAPLPMRTVSIPKTHGVNRASGGTPCEIGRANHPSERALC